MSYTRQLGVPDAASQLRLPTATQEKFLFSARVVRRWNNLPQKGSCFCFLTEQLQELLGQGAMYKDGLFMDTSVFCLLILESRDHS